MTATTSYLLLESGDRALQESGSAALLLEVVALVVVATSPDPAAGTILLDPAGLMTADPAAGTLLAAPADPAAADPRAGTVLPPASVPPAVLGGVDPAAGTNLILQ